MAKRSSRGDSNGAPPNTKAAGSKRMKARVCAPAAAVRAAHVIAQVRDAGARIVGSLPLLLHVIPVLHPVVVVEEAPSGGVAHAPPAGSNVVSPVHLRQA